MYPLLVVVIIGVPMLILVRKFKKKKEIKKSVLAFILMVVLIAVIGVGGYFVFSHNMTPDNVRINTGNYDLLESKDGEILKMSNGKVTCYVDKERHVIYENGILTFKDKDMTIYVSDEEETPRLVLKETIYSYDTWKKVLFKNKEIVESKAIIYLPK